jgi:hypothetical protein
MTVEISLDEAQSGRLKIDIVGNAVAAGLVGQVLNPEGHLLQITGGDLYIEEGADAASTFNIGITDTPGADASNLVSALAVNAADETVWKVVGTDIASEAAATTPKGVLWPANSYLTITSAAQASAGLKASLYLDFTRLD